MSEMVERAARAICKKRFCNGGIDDNGWDDCSAALKADYMSEARAAIEAIREPTKKMVSVGLEYIEEGDPIEAWQAMIDESLRSNDAGQPPLHP